jgi:hypothetical protein
MLSGTLSPSPSPSPSLTFTPSPIPSQVPPLTPGFDGHPLPEWFSLALGVTLLVLGIPEVFAGYRLFRYTLVIVGAGFAGIPCWVLTWDHVQQLGGGITDSTAVILGGVAGGVGGLLGGFLCWKVWKVGVFVIGAALGVVIAMVLHITLFCHLGMGNVPLIVAGVLLGLAAGALSVRFMRKAMVVSTSVLGAYAALRGVSLFVSGSYMDELQVAGKVQAGSPIPAAMYGYLGGMALLAAAGVLVQFLVTAAKPKKGGKDELEEEFDESEISLEAFGGACRGRGRTPTPPAPLTHTPTPPPPRSRLPKKEEKAGKEAQQERKAAARGATEPQGRRAAARLRRGRRVLRGGWR